MKTVIEWNGRDIPKALFGVPPGAYSIQRTLTETQMREARLDLDELGVDPIYRTAALAVLAHHGPSLAPLGIETVGDLETHATTIAQKRPGLWLRLPTLLRALPTDYELKACSNWRELAHHALRRVDPRYARTLRLRLGLDEVAETRAGTARRLGVSVSTIDTHERRVRIRWGHGWSERIASQLLAIVARRPIRLSRLMKRESFFEIGPNEEPPLALFIKLVDTRFAFEFFQKGGAIFIARTSRGKR